MVDVRFILNRLLRLKESTSPYADMVSKGMCRTPFHHIVLKKIMKFSKTL